MTTKTDFSGYALDGHLAGRLIAKPTRTFLSDLPATDGKTQPPGMNRITYRHFVINFDAGRARGFWVSNGSIHTVADFLPFLLDTLTDGFLRSEVLRRNGEK